MATPVQIVLNIVVWLLIKLPDWMMGWGIGKILDSLTERRMAAHPPGRVQLYDPTCGDEGIDLAEQRLLVSRAFGTYFSGLLERESNYVNLRGQIDCPAEPSQEALRPIQRVFWSLHSPRGPRLLVVAAEAGMGKSTLTAKIVRCLFQEKAVDVILGDSAKSEHADPLTSEVVEVEPGYYDVRSFYARLSDQLGLPAPSGDTEAMTAIRDRLEGRRAVIVVDNLETVRSGDKLLHSLQSLTNRDIRAIVTSRVVTGLRGLTPKRMVIRLNPLTDRQVVLAFLEWHINQHSDQHPGLEELRPDVDDRRRIQWLVERTGGIPLLIQMVTSDVARLSWDCLKRLPRLYGDRLLTYLYESRWDELGTLGVQGQVARATLEFVAGEQFRGRKVTLKRLERWAQEGDRPELLQDSLQLLYERFLIVNHDRKHGNFAVFPSLSEFLQHQDLT